ncbi:MAG TPA: hypothetical protein VGR28_00230, partial [Candidatus Thermoplasmatota archaeon]|nr:hypothetical protein [Candidatus Thermoplasmatota archaeon]
MRASRSRVLALTIVAVMMVPALPLDKLGPLGTANAQAPLDVLQGVLPPEVGWQDWQATHDLFAHTSGSPCVSGGDPNAPNPVAGVPGDRSCHLDQNTTKPTKQVESVVSRNAVSTDAIPPGTAPADVPDANRVWIRVEPELAHAMKINGLQANVFAAFNPPVTSCNGLTPQLGHVTMSFEVRLLQPGETGESTDGQTIGYYAKDFCPVDEHPDANLLPSEQGIGGGTIWPFEADVPVTGNLATVPQNGKLQFIIAVARPDVAAGTWHFDYNSTNAPTHLSVRSPDAFQFAAWTEDAQRHVTNIFPVPLFNEADRVSAVGFFAFKTAFGGYDDPQANSSTPQTTDAKWQFRVRAPNGQLVSLQDHGNFSDSTANSQTVHEFKNCDGQYTDYTPCGEQARTSGDTPPSARVFRTPDRPVVPGSSPVWNYTRGIIQSITGGNGGEFRLEVTGSVRGNTFETRLPEGFKFTVGGFGVRLDGLRIGDTREEFTHVVCTGAASGQCNGTESTTFLLNMTNLAGKVDNYTLSSTVLTPGSIGWSVVFGGPAVAGANKVILEGGNSTLLKVTVTPPASTPPGQSLTVRVRVTSDSSPDQFGEKDLTAQVSSTLQRGVGLTLFPDHATKQARRGQLTQFNYTIWNRGTSLDSFEAFCFDGPNPDIDPVTGRRIDDSWNGTIRLGDQVIGCKDTNATRRLVTSIQPGDVAFARVLLESSFNNTRARTVVVEAKSQGDPQKSERATATAELDLRTSIKVFILTDGLGNPDDPQSQTFASRTLRYGKDDPDVCPTPTMPPPPTGACTSGDNTELDTPYTKDWSQSDSLANVQQQRLDVEFGEWAIYRITVLNDGDRQEEVKVRLGEITNQTIDNCGMTPNAFNAVRSGQTPDIGMMDDSGVRLLRRPVLIQGIPDDSDDLLREGFLVPPGKSAVFYLRVHAEWNRHNLSRMAAGGGVNGVIGGAGQICDSRSTVDVDVFTNNVGLPNVRASVRAETSILNRAPTNAEELRKNVVIAEGARCGTPGAPLKPSPACDTEAAEIYESQQRTTCPPITSIDSPDRLYCRFLRPGQTQPWYFTVAKFWPIGDEFIVKPIRRVGGLSLTDLKNRGWQLGISEPGGTFTPSDIPTILEYPRTGTGRNNASGDEIVLRIDVKMPSNATVNDFAGLEVEAGGKFSGVTKPFAFFTVGAQKFKLNATSLNPGDIFIHPGDRAALNLNLSNEGSAVDRYSITLKDPIPGWTANFQPNETRVSPSRNKTVTVFLQSPSQGNFPLTVRGTIRVKSLVNLSEIPGDTLADVPFTVVVKPPPGPQDLRMSVQGAEARPIDPGGSLPYTINVSNPAPTPKTVAVRRLPSAALVPEFVDGWKDSLAEACFTIEAAATPAQPTNKSVAFTVTAAIDATEGTHVTYVLRADEVSSCSNIADSENFAQALVTAVVIGQVGIEVQPEAPALVFRPGESRVYSDVSAAGIAIVPRSGYAHLPVRVRNVGTANDTIAFQASLLNQSQLLGPTPWRLQMNAQSAASQGCTPFTSATGSLQAFAIEPGFSCIVLVNVTAPLAIPQLGQRADIDFVARATSPNVPPGSARLTARVQDYDTRIRVTNTTVDAIPGQTLNFLLNLTNGLPGDCERIGLCTGFDTFDVQVDIGGLAGFWNVTTELANPRECGTNCVSLLNGTSKDVQISVQVPRVRPDSAPTTGAVLGIIVRSRQAEALRPQAEALGAGSPLTQYLITV